MAAWCFPVGGDVDRLLYQILVVKNSAVTGFTSRVDYIIEFVEGDEVVIPETLVKEVCALVSKKLAAGVLPHEEARLRDLLPKVANGRRKDAPWLEAADGGDNVIGET